MSENVLIASKVDDKKQAIINEILRNKNVTVRFLQESTNKERKKILAEADIILTFNPVRDLEKEEFDLLNNVRFIQLFSAGADHIPFQDIPEHIEMASNTGAYGVPIAEHVLAMTLALAKRLFEEHENMKKGEFNQFNKVNKSIKDSTVGILGFGGIGKATARLFLSFGSKIFAMNTSGKSDEPADFIGTLNDLKYILESSDIMILSMPLTKKTRGLLGEKQLSWMKEDAILINVARGEIIKQKDLYEHLRNHPDFKAGLESWWVEPLRHGAFKLDYPFLDLPNVLASPHNSSIVPGIMDHGIAEAARNIKKFINGEPIKGRIDRKDYMQEK